MKTYPIRGRYGISAHIELVDDKYRFATVDDFCRFGHAEEGYSFVDPSGGPFIAVGDKLSYFHPNLPDDRITSISRDENGVFFTI